MNKLGKIFGLTVLCAGFLVLAPSFVKAAGCGSYDSCNTCNTCNDCCDPCDCWGDFEFGADFLYWKPCVGDLNYHVHYTNTTGHDTYKFHGICPDWEPGVRLYVAMPDFYCDWTLGASWTWIESDKNSCFKEAVVGESWKNTHHKGHWDVTYNEWDVLFSTDLSCKECHHFMPFFGVAGLFLDQSLSHKDEHDSAYYWKAKWSSDFWGVGLKAGTEYQYRFSDCLSFFTKASGTILYGDTDSEHTQEYALLTNGDKLTYKDDDCCHLVPGWHLGTGFSYDTCYCDWDFSFRFGYEFLQWINMRNHRDFSDFGGWGSESVRNDKNFGFHGFFAGLGMSF